MSDFKTNYEAMLAAEKEDEASKPPATVEEELRSLRDEVASLKQVAQRQLELQTPKVTRSKMSTAEKAKYISAHGSEAYFRIPWN